MSDAYSCSSSRRSATAVATRSEEHTSELQSQSNLVCRLLLGKKKHTSELQSQSNLVCRLLLEKKKNTTSLRSSAASRSKSLLGTDRGANATRRRTSI